MPQATTRAAVFTITYYILSFDFKLLLPADFDMIFDFLLIATTNSDFYLHILFCLFYFIFSSSNVNSLTNIYEILTITYVPYNFILLILA